MTRKVFWISKPILRLRVTVFSIIFMTNIIFLFSVQNPGMLAFNFTAKKVS